MRRWISKILNLEADVLFALIIVAVVVVLFTPRAHPAVNKELGDSPQTKFFALQEPGCSAYASDAQRLMLMKGAGLERDMVHKVFAPLQFGFYGPAVWPFFEDLLAETFNASETDSIEWARLHYELCMSQGGLKRLEGI